MVTLTIPWINLAIASEPTATKSAKIEDAPYVLKPKGTLTFTKDIAPIIFNNCTGCHRTGEVAPFTLLNYDDVQKKSKTIVKVIDKRYMPPWKAEHGFGDFIDERRLTSEQIGIIKQWVEEGTPEGDRSKLSPLPKFSSDWTLGEPDMIFQPPETYELSAEGRDVYQCFVIPTNFSEDRYISAIEMRPGNRSVVHHVIAYTDTTGKGRELDAATPEPGYRTFGGSGVRGAEWLEGWAPGKTPRRLPAGYGLRIPKGSDIILQVHYNKTGKPEADRTRMGVYFCQEPVDKHVRVARLLGLPLIIPAGESNYVSRASLTVPKDVTVLSVMPHMHLLGREMTVTANLPGGSDVPMVRVPDWDFNWQISYAFKEPVKLPAGSKVSLVARHDNSAENPNNPSNPPKLVRWGEQTTDEMCIAFFSYTVDAEHITKGIVEEGIRGRGANVDREAIQRDLIKTFDKNGDGKVDAQERAAALKLLQRRQEPEP
jgi:hypothetical protein